MRTIEEALRKADVWYPKRGDICWVNLDKRRPAIILSIDQLNKYALDVCVIPTTSERHEEFPTRVLLDEGEGGLTEKCWAKCDQPTTIEQNRVDSLIGKMPPEKFDEIQERVKQSLGFSKI